MRVEVYGDMTNSPGDITLRGLSRNWGQRNIQDESVEGGFEIVELIWESVGRTFVLLADQFGAGVKFYELSWLISLFLDSELQWILPLKMWVAENEEELVLRAKMFVDLFDVLMEVSRVVVV